jgi:hypothetical protein
MAGIKRVFDKRKDATNTITNGGAWRIGAGGLLMPCMNEHVGTMSTR